MMSTVVTTPTAVSTICDACLRARALNVVQPNLSATTTVAIANEPSTVSVYNHNKFDLACIILVYDTDVAVSVLGLGFFSGFLASNVVFSHVLEISAWQRTWPIKHTYRSVH